MTSASEVTMSQLSQDMPATPQRLGGSRSRTQSISSDRPSTVAAGVMSPPIYVSPEAAFIAPPSASQIVTNDHDNHADIWYDQHGLQPSGESVVVSNAALRHLNNFLDYLLYNFLAVSSSTTLASLRPAVSEVLKPKLAKDAINNADEELREYLGGDDDEEFLESPTASSPRDWDLELVWKRTRLRCMVYSSLGDMEEEDEDHHMEEGLLGEDDETSGSNVSPAVAIFLTSILEYLGEQALVSAGQAAWNRVRIRYEKETKHATKARSDTVDQIVVEEVDMERVALDRTLGRLWRAWKKRVRSGHASVDISHRPVSREKMYRQRLGSLSAADGAMPPAVRESAKELEEGAQNEEGVPTSVDEDEIAAAIPLPMSDKDIDEIEVPGLVYYSDDESEEDEPEELAISVRPKSLMVFSFPNELGLSPPTMSQPPTPKKATRRRANSVPTQAASPHQQRKKTATEAEATGAGHHPEGAVEEDSLHQDMNEQAAVAEATTNQALSGHDADEADKNQVDGTQAEHRISGSAQGAAVVASGVVDASVIAAPKQLVEHHDEDDDTDFEEIEEAQILTSSRISIGGSTSGRSDSPGGSDRGSRPPLSIHLPVRSASLRLVDVASPRTPSSRSQRSSLLQESNNASYSRSASRTSSVHAEEPRDAEDSRSFRISGTSSLGKARSNMAPSISEAEEIGEPSPMSATIFPRREPVPVPEGRPIPTAAETDHSEQTSHRQPPHPMFASVKRQSPASPQRSPHGDHDQIRPHFQPQRSPQTKATTLNTPPDSATFLEDAVGPLPQRQARQPPRQLSSNASSTGPTVPEKSSSRYQHGHSQTARVQPDTIGIPSVDRPAVHGENREGVRPLDQSQSRPFHTPASSISSNKMRTARASQDSTTARPEEVARNFEDLMKSNETIQYTLTPENMRELEGSPRSFQSGTQSKNRFTEDARHASRERAASSSVKPIEVRRSASVSRATGLRSHPVEVSTVPTVDTSDKGRPPVSMANRARGAAPQARDARLPRESVLEFAEFIRATGPPGGAQAPPVQPLQPATGLRRNQSLRHDGPPPVAYKMAADQGRPAAAGSISRARLQARDATVDNNNGNSDLIDFIRRGPPSSGNHRIPRTVAPFRTTMDSDQFTAVIGGRSMEASLSDAYDMRASQASTNATEMSAPSIQSSINSQSALLGRKATQNSNLFDEQDMMPVRKQRRVRDPYALDISDEEDDDFYDRPEPKRKAHAKEESLIDFLNSAPAPPPSDPVPFDFNLPRTQSMPVEPVPAPKKKASASGLMARFRQNSAAVGSRSHKSPPSSRGDPTSKGYIPIQVNIPAGGDLLPSFGSNTTPTVPSIPSQYAQRPSGRVPMKKFEPRDAVTLPSRGTSDLAEFLRSEPPPPPMPTPASWTTDQDESGGSRLFGRRKKSTGFA